MEDENLMDALQIERSFRGEHAALTLHVWLILSRLRREGARGKELSQVMYDTFQDDVEHRVHAEGVRVRVNKWLNELEQSFYGSALAYDKALQGGAGISLRFCTGTCTTARGTRAGRGRSSDTSGGNSGASA